MKYYLIVGFLCFFTACGTSEIGGLYDVLMHPLSSDWGVTEDSLIEWHIEKQEERLYKLSVIDTSWEYLGHKIDGQIDFVHLQRFKDDCSLNVLRMTIKEPYGDHFSGEAESSLVLCEDVILNERFTFEANKKDTE